MIPKQKEKIISFFIPSFHLGGGEKALINIAKMFAEKGYIVHLVTNKAHGPYQEIIGNSIKLIELGSKRLARTIFGLAKYLRKENPKYLISTAENSDIVAFFARIISFTGVKLIIRVGSMLTIVFKSHRKFFDKYIVPFLLGWALKSCYKIICVSNGVKNNLIEIFGPLSSKVVVIYTPKDIREIQDLSTENIDHKFFHNQNKPVIIGAGRMVAQKDFYSLIKAFLIVRKKIDVNLLILGNKGAESENLNNLVTELDLNESVDFLGFTKNPYAYFSKSNVFVLSSFHEGLPNVLIEALACGIPIVSTDCMFGPREILMDNSNYSNLIEDKLVKSDFGILVPVRNEKIIAEAIIEMLENKKLSDKYKEIGLLRAFDFDKEEIFKLYEQVFR